MSVTIRWTAAPEGKSFERGSSTTWATLREVFGADGDTVTLNEGDVRTLRAMAKTDGFGRDFYDEVADAIEAAGTIKVWGVW